MWCQLQALKCRFSVAPSSLCAPACLRRIQSHHQSGRESGRGRQPTAGLHALHGRCRGGRQVVLATLRGWALHHDLLSWCSPPCCEWSLALLSYSNHSSSPINFFLSLKITMQKGLWFWQCNNCNACVFLLIFADWPIWSAYVSVIQTYREWLCEDWRCCY